MSFFSDFISKVYIHTIWKKKLVCQGQPDSLNEWLTSQWKIECKTTTNCVAYKYNVFQVSVTCWLCFKTSVPFRKCFKVWQKYIFDRLKFHRSSDMPIISRCSIIRCMKYWINHTIASRKSIHHVNFYLNLFNLKYFVKQFFLHSHSLLLPILTPNGISCYAISGVLL